MIYTLCCMVQIRKTLSQVDRLNKNKKENTVRVFLVPSAFLVKLHEISVESYVPHAVFVPFIGLTSLRTDSGRARARETNILVQNKIYQNQVYQKRIHHPMKILHKVFSLMFAVVFFFFNKNVAVRHQSFKNQPRKMLFNQLRSFLQ